MRAFLALLLFAGPLLGQTPSGWGVIENSWGEIQTPTSGVSGLTAGRVTLSTGATSVGDDAGLTYSSTGTGFKLGIGTDVFLSRASSGLLLVEDGSGSPRDVRVRKITVDAGSLAAPSIDLSGGAGLTSGVLGLPVFTSGYGAHGVMVAGYAGDGIRVHGLNPISWATGDAYSTGSDTYMSRGGVAHVSIGATTTVGNEGGDIGARTGYFGTSVYSPLVSAAPDASGTNATGTDLTIQPQAPTGNATGTKIVLKAPTPQASGSTVQTQATVLTLQDSGSGGTSAPQALFADGTAAKPSLGFSAHVGEGFYFDAPSGLSIVSGGSTPLMAFSSGYPGSVMALNAVFSWGDLNARNPDLFLRKYAAATLQLGDIDAASPIAQTLQAQGSRATVDTDTAGANLTIRPGAGTGSATGSSLIFQTPTAGSTGTTAQTQTTRLTVSEPAVIAAVPVRLKGYTVATLPAGTVGDTAYVTDALAPAFGVALTGGGAVTIPAFYDGTNWIAH